jgi:hypothetical protein
VPPVTTATGSHRAAVARLSSLGLVLAFLAGCAPSPGLPAPSPASDAPVITPPAPASVTELEVSSEVYRTRIDVARNSIQLVVRNESGRPLELLSARLNSPWLLDELTRDRAVTVPPRSQRDLPMTLSAPRCPEDGEVRGPIEPPEAVLVIPLSDGFSDELRMPTTDRNGQWSEWITAACFADRVGRFVELSVRSVRGDAQTISLELVARPTRPTAVDGSFPVIQLDAVAGTVLLGTVDSGGLPVASIPLDIQISAHPSPALDIVRTLRFRPNRCDAHALADDKQGTLFRVTVTVAGHQSVVTVAADPPTKDAIYSEIARVCDERG